MVVYSFVSDITCDISPEELKKVPELKQINNLI